MTIHIGPVDPSHAGELMTVQRAAYVAEARQNGVLSIPPLEETLDEIRASLGLALGAWIGPRLVGSVRGRVDGSRMLISRLSVAPDVQGQGIGRALLEAITDARPDEVELLWLVTGARSDDNVRMYVKAGFVQTRAGVDEMNVPVVFLEKKVISSSG
ncbi:GNAT family N-acetyltransferase [Lentzea tibetensis]|uniref:GNAT family N-acetyltransferase n=1 Tax=Lentzea tibetensis TaxID=2591470 RepID=A0A563EWG7_9PSEU|nr:GNAT family N-acetyltransferase [Lentzea tibetensis]TWP51878.1 GNAT family N-acetyltransferase [Lentzea tibetensis]